MIRKGSLITVVVLSALIVLTVESCDPAKKYEKQEQENIDKYITDNPNLSFTKKTSGLYYYELVAGTGIMPVKHDTAYVKYTGKFLNGTIFNTNVGKADTLKVPVDEGWVIAGFDEGITYMKVGGKSTFMIPSYLGYGSSQYYSIPGYSTLLFDVELVKVKLGPAK
jgi:FKBP-type peptidyl-prolyl cis-trans isomerase FkpA